MRALVLIVCLFATAAPASPEPELIRPKPVEPELVRPTKRRVPRPHQALAPRTQAPKPVDEAMRARIRDAAVRSSLDPRLVEALVQVESNFYEGATSVKGAMGLMQVMPGFANECEIHDPYNAVNNLMGACDCLRRLVNRYRGNLKLALAAYNAGPGNVDRYRGVPPFAETQAYVEKILALYKTLRSRRG